MYLYTGLGVTCYDDKYFVGTYWQFTAANILTILTVPIKMYIC